MGSCARFSGETHEYRWVCEKRGFEGKVAWNFFTSLKVMGVKKGFDQGVRGARVWTSRE